MAAKRIYSPSILINSVQYKCKARSVTLEPNGTALNFCEDEFDFSAEIELGYGTGESWTLLSALAKTIVDVVLKPEDADVAAANPSATFQFRVPSVSFMLSATRGDRQIMTLSGPTETEPVYATT